MAVRTGRPSERALCLEVWLGPMEGVRHCSPVGETGAVKIGRRRLDEKRGVKNDLVLGNGEGISGFHAEVRVEQGRIILHDLNSTNGTFAGGQRISGEVPIEEGEPFVLSTTLIVASWTAETPAPLAAPSDEEIAASLPFQSLLAAAGRVAGRRGEGWVDTRHLADALIDSRDESIGQALRGAGLSADQAVKELWSGAFFRGPLQWLRRFLMIPEGVPTPEGKLLTSPAVRGIFAAASTRLTGYTDAEAKALAAQALFVALFNGPGPVPTWLKDRKVRPEPVPASRRAGARKTSRSGRPSSPSPLPEEPTIRQATAGFVPSETHVLANRASLPEKAPTSSARATPIGRLSGAAQAVRDPLAAQVPTTGDAVLDQRARAIAAEIDEAATLYRFSTPEDRRAVMKTLVKRALSAIAPENRARILAQIRVQFPVTAAPPSEVSDESPKLRARIRELEQRLQELAGEREAGTKKGASGASGSGDWRSVIGPPGSGPASPEAQALRATVAFARNLEKFLLGLIQAATTPGDATTSFRLPIYRYTLDHVLQSISAGKATGLEGLPDYLRELERWQVAILAAHHASPRIWFEKLWKKMNPAVIEAGSGKPGSWKIGGQSSDWWNRYKEVVRGLNPDVVQDQVLQTASKTAQEEFEKLSKTKN